MLPWKTSRTLQGIIMLHRITPGGNFKGLDWVCYRENLRLSQDYCEVRYFRVVTSLKDSRGEEIFEKTSAYFDLQKNSSQKKGNHDNPALSLGAIRKSLGKLWKNTIILKKLVNINLSLLCQKSFSSMHHLTSV